MSIGRLEAGTVSFRAIQQDQLGACKPLLDASNPVDVKELAAVQPDFLKNLKVNGINPTPTDEASIQLNLVDVYGESIDTRGFEQLVNHMDGLSQEQTSTLQNALLAVSATENNSQTQGDTYGMRISQVNLELKYISANLVPEQYQEQFNSFANDYTRQLSDHYVDYLTKFATQLAGRTDPVAVMTGWLEKGKAMVNSLQDGSNDFQVLEQKYRSLYNTVDVTNPNTVKQQLNSVYQTILSNSGAYSGDSSLAAEIKYLSEGWNKLMDALGDQQNKFTTAVDRLA